MSDAVRSDTSGVGYLVGQTARALRSSLAKELRQHGLDDSDFIVLQNISSAAQVLMPLTANELSEQNNLPIEEVTASVAKLARDGWIESGSEHGAHLVPTAKTKRVIPVLRDNAKWMLERALNGFSRTEIHELSDLLSRMLENLR